MQVLALDVEGKTAADVARKGGCEQQLPFESMPPAHPGPWMPLLSAPCLCEGP